MLSSGGRAHRRRRSGARRPRERGARPTRPVGPHRRDHRDGVLDRVEHDHQGRAAPAPRRGCRSGRDWRAAAPPSAAPCRSRDSRRCRPPSAAARRAARCGFRRSARAAPRAAPRGRARTRRGVPRRGLISARPSSAPDQIGIEPDDRIAPAHRAALDRFEQEAHRPAARDLEEGRDRRLEVGDQRGPHDLRLAARIALGEGVLAAGSICMEGQFVVPPPPTTWFSAL